MKTILLYGSTTHRNTGDLAMMHGIIFWLRNNGYGDRIQLLTGNPVKSAREFQIPCIMSYDAYLRAPCHRQPTRARIIWNGIKLLFQLVVWLHLSQRLAARFTPASTITNFEILAGSCAILVHGSGSFNSIFWPGWLYPKAITSIATHLLNVPVLMTSQGIGPLNGIMDRLRACIFFLHASFVGVRDGKYSYDCAVSNGASADRVFYTGDDSLLLPRADDHQISRILQKEGVPDGCPLMGINFRDASSYHPDFCDHGYEIIAEALDRIINKHAFHIVFIPVTYDTQDDDRKSAAEVIRYMKHSSHVTNISGVYDGTVIRGLIDRMTLVAGSSYHFLLFALSQTLPTLALTKNEYYRAKHKGLMSLYEQEDHLIHMAEASSEDVVANIENLLYHQNDIRQKLQERQVILESTAQASYAMLKRKF